MRILMFGSRNWTYADKIENVFRRLNHSDVIIHGGARGADELAERIALRLGMRVEAYYAEWRALGLRAGPLRNQRMIDSQIDRAYGFRIAGRSPGTDDMIRRLEMASVPYSLEVLPDEYPPTL